MIDKHESSLSELASGVLAEVVALDGDADLRLRLMELGFCPDVKVRVVRRAPFGCPLEVDVDGSRFSVRDDVARGVRLRHV